MITSRIVTNPIQSIRSVIFARTACHENENNFKGLQTKNLVQLTQNLPYNQNNDNNFAMLIRLNSNQN